MAKDPSLVINVDFSDVKESSGINPKQQDEGDYLAKIIKVEMTKTKAKDGKAPEPMALILFQDANMRSAVYPYYCTFGDNMLWKIRNTFIAAGVPVPKSKGKIDLGKLINKEVGITLEDDEYDGKMKSVISAVFHKDELEPTEAEEDDFEEEEDDEEEVVEEAPKKKRKAAPVVEEEDDEEEEDEEEEEAPKVSKRTAARRAAKEAAAAAAEEDEDDEEEEEEAPAPVKKSKKAKAAPVVEEDDEEDDDLELDDI